MKTFIIEYKSSAQKELKKLPKHIAKRVYEAIEGLSKDPKPSSSIKMQGEHNKWRLRIGDYRVVYSIYEKTCLIEIVRIRHRQGAYKK